MAAALGSHAHEVVPRFVAMVRARANANHRAERPAARAELEAALAALASAYGTGAPAARRLEDGLARARAVFGLSQDEAFLLGLTALVEVDARVRGLLAALGAASRARPTAGGLFELMRPGLSGLRWLRADAPLSRYALIALEGDGPFDTRALRVPDELWPRLVAGDAPPAALDLRPLSVDPVGELRLDEADATRLRDAARWLAGGDARLVCVIGCTDSDRERVACALAHAGGRAALVVRDGHAAAAGELRRDALWYGATVAVLGDADAPGDAAVELARSAEAPVVWARTRGSLEALAPHRDIRTLSIAPPDLERRTRLWQRALGAGDADDRPVDAARRFRFGAARIEAAARLARAACDGESPTTEQIAHASHLLPETDLGSLARPLPLRFRRDDLVVPRDTARELEVAFASARHWTTVVEHWRAGGAGAPPGVAFLMIGPPGTGKTMAAQVLGRELSVPVWRVDLSAVVDKYVGETEKNLARLFDEAEAAGGILFFDEADALFGKRTRVADAHDRYANIETGFLLQRIEAHAGITLLATNLRDNLDTAFLRRMHAVIDFPAPGRDEREAIWTRHLPAAAHLAADIDLPYLARFPLTGAQICNATLTASVLAAEAGAQVDMERAVIAAALQLRQEGRLVSSADFGPWQARVEELLGRRGRG